MVDRRIVRAQARRVAAAENIPLVEAEERVATQLARQQWQQRMDQLEAVKRQRFGVHQRHYARAQSQRGRMWYDDY